MAVQGSSSLTDKILSAEKREELLLLLIAALMSALGIVFWHSFSTLEDQLNEASIEIHSVSSSMNTFSNELIKIQTHVFDHEKEKSIWTDRILSNEQHLKKLDSAIHDVKTTASARKDPFTGTQGREHWKHIRENASNINEIYKSCCRNLKN